MEFKHVSVLLEETIEGFENFGTIRAIDLDPSSFSLNTRQVYTVVWDGTTYKNFICTNTGWSLIIGSPDEDFSKYPFTIEVYEGKFISIITNTSETSHTVKIIEMRTEITKIDEKYLPASVGKSTTGIEYTLYDIENDKFIPVNEGMLTEYPFASDIFDLLCVGSPFGDADCDNDLTVMDATTIQRCLAQLETFTNKEYLLKYGNYPTDFRSDINLDGSVNVLDATEIQLRLVSASDMNF